MNNTDPAHIEHGTLKIKLRNTIIGLRKPIVTGILNITPDSFYDGGKHMAENNYLKHAEKLLHEGASIIDIGAVSTRPGANEISEMDEWQRLLPVLKALVRHFPEAVFSVDTWRSTVAEKAITEGAQVVNDISGGTFDPKMFDTIQRLKVPYIMMHIKGTPYNMQVNPVYENVVAEVKNFFCIQVKKLTGLGITDNIILDPGFGFGKTVEHNYQLLKGLASFRELGCPVMAGLSRKSMINRILNTKPDEALNGTTVLNTIALLNGANMLRVHDVKEAMEAIRLVEYYKKTEGSY